MKLAFSNLAWSPVADREVAGILRAGGFAGVELAPTKLWPDLAGVTNAQLAHYRNFWEVEGFPIVALQAILFGRGDLQLFGSEEQRQDLERFLLRTVEICSMLGAGVIVLGAPANRRRGSKSLAEARELALPFFSRVGGAAADHNVTVCIEPNPAAYGCDWITTASEGREFVDEVDSAGFRLHLDAGALAITSADLVSDISESHPLLRHFHISEPGLVMIGKGGTDHLATARALRESGYDGWCSVEMKEPAAGALQMIAAATTVALREYGTDGG